MHDPGPPAGLSISILYDSTLIRRLLLYLQVAAYEAILHRELPKPPGSHLPCPDQLLQDYPGSDKPGAGLNGLSLPAGAVGRKNLRNRLSEPYQGQYLLPGKANHYLNDTRLIKKCLRHRDSASGFLTRRPSRLSTGVTQYYFSLGVMDRLRPSITPRICIHLRVVNS